MQVSKNELKRLERCAATYKAVAHPIRLGILRNFCTCGCEKLTVKSIYEELGIEQPVASHHLGILKRSGVLRREQEAGNTYYCVCKDDDCVSSILETLND